VVARTLLVVSYGGLSSCYDADNMFWVVAAYFFFKCMHTWTSCWVIWNWSWENNSWSMRCNRSDSICFSDVYYY